jgi:hypothetical protein
VRVDERRHRRPQIALKRVTTKRTTGENKEACMPSNEQSGDRRGFQPHDGNATVQELGKALASINRYILAHEPNLTNGHGASREEVDRMQATQRKCLQVLCGIDDPLVQAIAAKLQLDRHHHNAQQLIRHLADRAAH